jgi:acyl carrier protein
MTVTTTTAMKKLTSLLARVFEVDESQINDNTSPENTEKWDSFNTLSLVMELEKEFSIQLKFEEIVAIKSVKDIKSTLKGHNVDL